MSRRAYASSSNAQQAAAGGAAPNVLIVAGERSGDAHGAAFVRAVAELGARLRFVGIGGEAMRAAGVVTRWDAAAMAVVGLREGLGKLPMLWRAFHDIVRTAQRECVTAAVLIDYPGFNLRLAERLNAQGVPVLYYIAPQVWAWRRRRLVRLAGCVDQVLLILPFETPYFEAAGIAATYVGHPTVDAMAQAPPRDVARRQLGLPDSATVVGLAPGSRAQEVRVLLPSFLDAAAIIAARKPQARFLLPLAGEELRHLVQEELSRAAVPVQVECGRTADVLRACDALLVASGTATLEAGILGTPMVIAYKLRRSTYWFARRLVKLEHIGLVNLIAGRGIVPERLQHACTPDTLAAALLDLLPGELLPGSAAADAQRRQLAAMAEKLGKPGAAERAARAFLEFFHRHTSENADGPAAAGRSGVRLERKP